MKIIVRSVCMMLVGVLSAGNLMAAEEGKGSIDWEGGFVVATGYGTAGAGEPKAKARLKAQRAAEAVAQRALLETIKGVRINSQTTVRNMMLEEDVITTRVEGILKGAVITKREVEIVDGAPLVTVEMRVCLTAGPAECASKPTLIGVLDVDKRKEPPFVPAARYVPPPAETPKNDVPPPAAQPQANIEAICDLSRPITALVINLDGRYFEREVLPVIITSASGDFQTVYSVKSVNPRVVRTYGAVRYSDTLDNARKLQNVGNNPMIVTAHDITKENMIIIRPKDAALIRQSIGNGNDYLGEAKVVISVR